MHPCTTRDRATTDCTFCNLAEGYDEAWLSTGIESEAAVAVIFIEYPLESVLIGLYYIRWHGF